MKMATKQSAYRSVMDGGSMIAEWTVELFIFWVGEASKQL
jgi:hypothetical protein